MGIFNTRMVRFLLGFAAIIAMGLLGMFLAGIYNVGGDAQTASQRDLSKCLTGDPKNC